MVVKKKKRITPIISLMPIIIGAAIALIAYLLLYSLITKRHYELYADNVILNAENHIERINESRVTVNTITNEFNERLILAANYIYERSDMLSDELLESAKESFNLANIYHFKADGYEIFHTTSKEDSDKYVLAEHPYIQIYLNSTEDPYKEGIRDSVTSDTTDLYLYKRMPNNDFIQLSINAKEINRLIDSYSDEYILSKISEDSKQVLNSHIIKPDYSVISINNSDLIYDKKKVELLYKDVFEGEKQNVRRYSNSESQEVLVVSRPVYEDGEVIQVISIYYSLKEYTEVYNVTIMLVLLITILSFLIYGGLLIFFVLMPLYQLEKSIFSFDANTGDFNMPESPSYLFKQAFDALQGLSNHIHDVNFENEELNQSIYNLAITDFLTKVPNRRYLIESIESYLKDEEKFATIFIDIDNFKTFNDTKGHAYGDMLLVEVVNRLTKLKTNDVFVARYGGDEFILLYKYNNLSRLNKLIKEIYAIFKKPIVIDKENNLVDLSVGISLYPENGLTYTDLIRKADLAMYYAKERNKNSYSYYEHFMGEHLEKELYVREQIEIAIRDKGFTILLQPQVNIKTGEISSYEALARIKNSDISPVDFIKVAEKYNLMDDFTIIIIDLAIESLVRLREENMLKTIYVNFSINEIKDMSMIYYILREMEKFQIDVGYFGIEITENDLIIKEELSKNFFKNLKEYGFKIAIDDFGSGNASLDYLVNYPLRLVKLDRNFIKRYLNKDSMLIFETIVFLAHELEYIVLAEGVETLEQVELLKQTDCTLVQGYYYYRPMKLKDIIKINENK